MSIHQTQKRRSQETNAPDKKPKPKKPAFDPQVILMPINFAWDEVGIYPLLTVLLGVVGVYFSVWLANGGAEELSIWFR